MKREKKIVKKVINAFLIYLKDVYESYRSKLQGVNFSEFKLYKYLKQYKKEKRKDKYTYWDLKQYFFDHIDDLDPYIDELLKIMYEMIDKMIGEL